LGVKFFVCPSILLNNKECLPLGVNKGVVNFTPRGQISPLGARGEVKNAPLLSRAVVGIGLTQRFEFGLVWA
jgi:hypothetical protein